MADHEQSERLFALAHELVRRTAGRQANEVARINIKPLIIESNKASTRNDIDGLIFLGMDMLLR